MNRRDLVKAVAAHTEQDTRQVDDILRGFTEVVTAVVAKGEPVAISGFAKFAKIDRKARMARNPATGEPVKVKASKKARITPLKAFKDSVITPSQAPKLARGVWPPAPAAASTRPAGRAAAKPAATRRKATTAASTSSRSTSARATSTRRPAASRTTAARSTRAASTRATPARAASTRATPARRSTAATTTRRRSSR